MPHRFPLGNVGAGRTGLQSYGSSLPLRHFVGYGTAWECLVRNMIVVQPAGWPLKIGKKKQKDALYSNLGVPDDEGVELLANDDSRRRSTVQISCKETLAIRNSSACCNTELGYG